MFIARYFEPSILIDKLEWYAIQYPAPYNYFNSSLVFNGMRYKLGIIIAIQYQFVGSNLRT